MMTPAIAWCLTVALASMPAHIVTLCIYDDKLPLKGANLVFGLAALAFSAAVVGGFLGALIAFIWGFVP